MSRPRAQLRHQRAMRLPSICFGVLVLLAAMSHAEAQVIELTIGTASGAPGGTADVTFTLTDPTGTVVGAGLFVAFPAGTLGALSIDPKNDCVIASGLTSTHMLAANPLNLPPGGQGFDLEVAVLTDAPGSPNLPIGTGDLATCTFHIPDTAQLGSSVELTGTMSLVSFANAQTLPLPDVSGAVNIVPAATPTSTVPPGSTPTNTIPVAATPTSTPLVPTSTPKPANTNTPVPTNTRAAATSTPGVAPQAVGGGGGCSIAEPMPASSAALVWLVVPATLLLRRRRLGR